MSRRLSLAKNYVRRNVKFSTVSSASAAKKETSYDDATPRFKCNKLMVKDRIGQGAFGDVYNTDYRALGEITTETVIIKKMLNAVDEEEKKLFYKKKWLS